MPANITRRRILKYADKESWNRDYDEAQSCFDLEERLAWGIQIFRGLLEVEYRIQAGVTPCTKSEAEHAFETTPLLCKIWLDASEFYGKVAEGFVQAGYEVDGLGEFHEIIEEARCFLGNLELEDELPPIEELKLRAQPHNPRPDRYGA